jgi:hypothetical protein
LIRFYGIEAVGEAKILKKTQISCHVFSATTFLMLGSKFIERRIGNPPTLPFLVDMLCTPM